MNYLADIILMTQPQPGTKSWTTFVPLILVIVVFYFFLIRPQMKRQKDLKNFRESLKKGDKIITAGGIYGKINNISDNIVTIDVGNNMLLKVDKSAIVRSEVDIENAQ
jgi:preprotein translocase subunit YajC